MAFYSWDSSTAKTNRNTSWTWCSGLSFVLIIFVLSTLIFSIKWTKTNFMRLEAKEWILVGGVTSFSAQFRIRLAETKTFFVRKEDSLRRQTSLIFSQDLKPSSSNDPATWVVPLLIENIFEPQTKYCYGLIGRGVGRESSTSQGCFMTPAPEGTRFDFSVVASAGAMTGSTSEVFEFIADEEPLLMLHLGNMHYENINTNDLEARLRAISMVLSSKTQRILFASMALVYMWDDHDWLGKNSGVNSEGEVGGRDAALVSYQVAIPSYPLALVSTKDVSKNFASLRSPRPRSPYHAFTIGTVRFVVSDLRSEANSTHVYSDAQRDWFFGELAQAFRYDFLVWITNKSWIGRFDSENDDWSGTIVDREELSDYISSLNSPNIFAVSADAEMLAFDDGRNTYYGSSSASVPSFPILQSGPLDRVGNVKGGPYSDGCHALTKERSHQYSVISFESNLANEYCIKITSYRVVRGSKRLVLQRELCGSNIFVGSTITARQGTCQGRTLSSATIGLLTVAAVVTLLTTTICFFLVVDVAWAIGLTVMACIGFLVTGLVGIFVPISYGVGSYPSFLLALVLFLQACLVQFFVAGWLYWTTREYSREITATSSTLAEVSNTYGGG